MPDPRQKRVKELFQAAADLRPADRHAFLEAQCGADDALRTAVESLLAAGEDKDVLLDRRPFLSAAGSGTGSPDSASPTASLGTAVGPSLVIDRYRLLEKLGEGGMGEVWLAEQQAPVVRRVALKLIKAGMDTAQVIARFEAERQALALMDHPAIARVFDAGATPEGRPYFVMEPVTGLPITQHSDRERLDIAARLELFMQVCEGVQHAHQKAILHRDLKPSNVLVTAQDGRAAPKIIDFGVAKAMAQPLTAHTLHTGLGILGTPGYMSPEQADLGRQDVDTRTDVYSLGVMLYELLVGVLPHEPERLRRAGWEGLGRLLRDEEPATPSKRLTTLPADTLDVSARLRRLDVPALRRHVSGDLDWITMKAIEPDRERRYGSPADLAEDIRRHLRDEPVLAAAPTAAYRLGKFVRRHRFGVAAAAAIGLVVAAGLVGTTTGLVRARRAESEARKQAAASERVAGFLSSVLASVDPARMGTTLVDDLRRRVEKVERGRGGSETQVAATLAAFDGATKGINRVDAARDLVDQEILSRAGHSIDEQMRSDPLLAARLQSTLGSTYYDLGLFEKAAVYHLKALETRRRELGLEHPDTLRSMDALGRSLHVSGRIDEAETTLRQAIDIQSRVLGAEHPDTLQSMNDLAYAMSFAGKNKESEALYRKTLESRRRVLGNESPDAALTMRLLADNQVLQGRFAEAEQLYREALAIQRRVLGPEVHETLRSMGNMARALTGLGRHDEAERVSLEVIDIRRRTSGEDSIYTVLSLGYLGMGYANQGRRQDAERVLMEALERSRRSEVSLVTALINYTLAPILRSQGRLPEAETLYRETVEIQRGTGSGRAVAGTLRLLAEVLVQEDRCQEAEPVYREIVTIQEREFGADASPTIAAKWDLARLYWGTADVERGRSNVASFLADLERLAKQPEAKADFLNLYAGCLLICEPVDVRDPQRAFPFAEKAVAASGRKDANILDTLALAYHLTGRDSEALKIQREAITMLPSGPSRLREELERNLATYEQALRRR